MGIVNLTPDSFYDTSRATEEEILSKLVCRHFEEGVDIIDVGAFSTRPGCQMITVEEEIERLRQGIRVIKDTAPSSIISIDTFRSEVALFAVRELGCDIINDISGGDFDKEMFNVVARLNVPYILTYSPETFAGMHEVTPSENIVVDSLQNLAKKLTELQLLGVNDIIIDPGIGFGKSYEQNCQIISNLSSYEVLHKPILVGVSRKRIITETLGITADKALNGTTALNSFCLDRGVSILRVHDVNAAKECIKIYNALTSH